MDISANLPGRGYGRVRIREGIIDGIDRMGPERAGELYLAPGLIDIQLNGFAGVDFSAPNLEPEQLIAMLPELWRTGLVAFCPTLITNSVEALSRNFRVLEQARRLDARFALAVPCYHLEGPYLSPGPSHGAHDPHWMHPPDWEEFCRLQQAAGGRIGIVTIAPELPGACEFIRRAAEQGVIVSIGHTDGGPRDVHQAVLAGARLSTHLGNGCPQQIDRHANPIWAQLAAGELAASIICDTFHLPEDLVRVVARMKGIERTILITDATHVATLPPGRYSLVGVPIELLPGGKVVRVDGNCLAGSAVTMNRAVAVFRQYTGLALAEALAAAATAPARLLARPQLCAELAPGERANLILFRPEPDALAIDRLWLGGEVLHANTADGLSS